MSFQIVVLPNPVICRAVAIVIVSGCTKPPALSCALMMSILVKDITFALSGISINHPTK
jgi:hypothetical protein